MTTRKLTFHTDPGHGWLEVSRADLDTLEIDEKITPYSYQRADRVYLEEDLDAQTYLEAARAAGWTVNIREKHRDPSPIPDFPHYRPTARALIDAIGRAADRLFSTTSKA